MLSAKATQQRILITNCGVVPMLYISTDVSGCKESQFYSLPLHLFACCACFRFSTYLPTIFQGLIPRKIAGKYMENLKQASGEIFLVGRMKNFRDKCIENLKKWFLCMQLHVMPSNFCNRICTSASKALTWNSHTTTVNSHVVAYPSRWLPNLWQGVLDKTLLMCYLPSFVSFCFSPFWVIIWTLTRVHQEKM